ncbi:uncharacterized protein AB675_6712 [Cyphellophora attinorum]|uniref:Uncharacterized protein n=1 Tax=Cyphellophora attinorum TaxID=1664694 RepID=A0A0N1HV69_9EURO|nr:uncharacterized protein AB675_6712 [Phialophora attinorum]KPI43556.1 hypothetical protein AB675_6712 [Phialophora attinorum]
MQKRCGCKVAGRPEYRIKTIAQRYDQYSRPTKVHTHAVVLEKAVTHPDGKNLIISLADRTGSAKFMIERPSTNKEDLLADHSPNTNPLPDPPKVPAFITMSWDWGLSLQPGHLVCFSSSAPVEVVESKTTSALKWPLRLLGGTVGVTGYAIAGVGKLLQKAADKLMMGQPRTMVSRADAVFMDEHDQRRVLGKRNGTPRWMRCTDVAKGRAKEWKKIQKSHYKHCPGSQQQQDAKVTPQPRRPFQNGLGLMERIALASVGESKPRWRVAKRRVMASEKRECESVDDEDARTEGASSRKSLLSRPKSRLGRATIRHGNFDEKREWGGSSDEDARTEVPSSRESLESHPRGRLGWSTMKRYLDS